MILSEQMLKSSGVLLSSMPSLSDEAWLAGLIDGEGCFFVRFDSRYGNFEPQFGVALNTGPWSVRVEKILDEARIHYGKSTSRKMTKIAVSGWQHIESLCRLLEPLSSVKHPHISILLEASTSPPLVSYLWHDGGKRWFRRINWSDAERAMILKENLSAQNAKNGHTIWTREKITSVLQARDWKPSSWRYRRPTRASLG